VRKAKVKDMGDLKIGERGKTSRIKRETKQNEEGKMRQSLEGLFQQDKILVYFEGSTRFRNYYAVFVHAIKRLNSLLC